MRRFDAQPQSRSVRELDLCGADIELGNFILGLVRADGTGREASRALLREIRGHIGVSDRKSTRLNSSHRT